MFKENMKETKDPRHELQSPYGASHGVGHRTPVGSKKPRKVEVIPMKSKCDMHEECRRK